MTPARAFFFAMGTGFERRLAAQERHESDTVDVRRTMPMLLQLRCGDKVQIKANQRSYGLLLLWCREKPANIALNVAHQVDPKLLSSRSGRQAEVQRTLKGLCGGTKERIASNTLWYTHIRVPKRVRNSPWNKTAKTTLLKRKKIF